MSPLNWGLGHVSRTVPIIQYLLENENEVIICCDENQESFYRSYFPEIWYVPHAGYPFAFNGKGKWTLDILKNFGELHFFLQREKKRVKDLVEKFNPDIIISDQRFGFFSKSVKSIVISHQLNLPVPKWNVLAKFWNAKLLSAFDEIWIPDNENQELSGNLSDGKFRNKHFIGTCSRFQDIKIEEDFEKEPYEFLGIISGPAPYNQQLLDLIIKKLKPSHKKSVIIVPKNLYNANLSSKNIEVISSPRHEEFVQLLRSSEVVISRSGYSTMMDLNELGNRAILIPTPGQHEQNYLFEFHKDKAKWTFVTEKEFLSLEI